MLTECLAPNRACLRASFLIALTALSALAAPAAAAQEPLRPLGMDMGSARALADAGAPARYGSYWVGPWMATSGWGGLDRALDSAVAMGVTPVVYWYYWGDSISPSCVENGCDGRNQTQWLQMTDTLAERVRARMGGRETLIVLENEFNKGGITGAYAPTFDAKLETVAARLKQVPGVVVVLGFGAWAENDWLKFPRAAAKSDMIGFQTMRASTRDTEASYRGAADRVASLAAFVDRSFAKPSFLYDLALSSYPDASWERVQAETLQAVLGVLGSPGAGGLQGIVYRSLRDTYMDPANYYGHAESHWGLQRSNGSAKPAWDVWRSAAPPSHPRVPATFEAEAMSPTAGGRHSDPAATGGGAWNVWSDGELRKTVVADAPGEHRVVVRALGQSAGGVDPRMEVRLDGAAVATFFVAPGAWRDYAADLRLPATPATVSVAFTNDGIVNGSDRNLVVDTVAVRVNAPPAAAFTASTSHLSASFDASASRDPDGDALSYAWDFGDGSTGSGMQAGHAYAKAGDYVVTLVVSDGRSSASATATVRAVQPNAPPAASFSWTADRLAVSFDATASSDPDGDALSYAWDFGDGSAGTGALAAHEYARPGDYQVRLVVHDGRASAETSRTVTASYPAPVASAAVSGGGSAYFFNASASADPAGGALSYAWDFGDNATAAGATAKHVYAKPGRYEARLTVTNRFGMQATQAVAIDAAPYAASFNATNRGGNEWWVQVTVSSNEPTAAVCASIDGGACQPLKLQWWGDWAASLRAPAGSRVVFTATSETGATGTSVAYAWPTGKPYMTATFEPSGNKWWIQTMVRATSTVTSVCASVNGGACQQLQLQSWGGWALSTKVPAGARVTFTAASADQEKVTSPAYVWPPK